MNAADDMTPEATRSFWGAGGMHVNKKTKIRWQAVVTSTFRKLQIKQSPHHPTNPL